MKAMPTIQDVKGPAVRINPDLNKYNNVVLFPEKLAKANELLRKAGPPKFPERKK
jgi:hypothetical protein